MNEDTCFICGQRKPNSIETHHIVPRRFGGSDSDENLVDLCASCHSALEKLYDDRFYEELGVRTHDAPPDIEYTKVANLTEFEDEDVAYIAPRERFYRVERGEKEPVRGTGMEEYVSFRQILVNMSGDIDTFGYSLPVEQSKASLPQEIEHLKEYQRLEFYKIEVDGDLIDILGRELDRGPGPD